MIVIALALVLIAAACAAVLMDATRSMLPAVGQPIPLRPVAQGPIQGPTEVPTQRNREVAPDAIDDAHRAYSFVAALPAEPRAILRASL